MRRWTRDRIIGRYRRHDLRRRVTAGPAARPCRAPSSGCLRSTTTTTTSICALTSLSSASPGHPVARGRTTILPQGRHVASASRYAGSRQLRRRYPRFRSSAVTREPAEAEVNSRRSRQLRKTAHHGQRQLFSAERNFYFGRRRRRRR